MTVELRDIRRRMAGTRQIRKVTSALQKVAAAQLVNDRKLLDTSRRYIERFRYLLRELCIAAPEAAHPLMRRPRGGAIGIIVFGSDRGLCGGFNTALASALDAFRKKHLKDTFRLWIVGRVIHRKARRLGIEIDSAHRQPSRSDRTASLNELADIVIRQFNAGLVREVNLLYSRYVSNLRQDPVFEPLLPIRPTEWHLAATALPVADGRGRLRAASFEPAPAVMLDTLVPEFLRRSLDHAFINSMSSEDAARQIAMSRASENASEMLTGLSMQFSRLRQETITTEMIEIAGGSLLSWPQDASST